MVRRQTLPFPDGTGDPKIKYENKGNGGPGQEISTTTWSTQLKKMKKKKKIRCVRV
jgi:hypothetical protein